MLSLLKNIGKKSRGGAKALSQKNTKDFATVKMTTPKLVYISMEQNIGVPGKPLVRIGDKVEIGQVIADNSALVSVPIHASVSGEVVSITKMRYLHNKNPYAIVIKSDGLDEKYEENKEIPINTKEDFIHAVRRSGVVGLGGAGFPTHIKYNTTSTIDYLLVNGAECEPYITADYREIMENYNDLLAGVRLTKKMLNIKKAYIAIENNKPDAINLLNQKIRDNSDGDIEVVPLRARYPQGAERVLIYECTGRIVPEGTLPLDVGCLVTNVTTVSSVYKYIRTSQPLTHKKVTVDGGAMNKKMNVKVPIGTPVRDILNFCGGYKEKPARLIMGGPMMGSNLDIDDYPIIKTTNAILAFNEKEAYLGKQTNCIRCGKCADACPLSLSPLGYERAYDSADIFELKSLKVSTCMECGTCSYVCPARRDLVGKIRLGKALIVKSPANKGSDNND